MSTSAIGIDLGTTNCCVAVWQGDGVEIISNDVGGRVTPSYVSFDDDERLIGAPAKAQAHKNEKNTVFAVKRLMGRPFSDTAVQSDIKLKRWPFQVREGPGDVPTIRVQYRGEQKDLAPQEISAMLLSAAKAYAEDFLDDEVTQAVITVPAYFNDAQRAATKAAGEIAGLEVLRILNEPTAGALAYGVDKSRSVKSKVLIYDLGGGTCDVSIQEIEAEDFRVVAVRGDTHLGGEDIDNALVEHFLQEIKQECGMNLSSDTRARRRLQTAAEVAKITLSGSDTAYVEVDGLLNGRDFQTRVTRASFEGLCEGLFRRCITPVEQCLKDAGLEAEDLDEVVLVGGSTRIPKVQTLLQRLLNGKALNKSVNPDEAVAYGAAVQAAMLTDTYDPKLQRLSLQDVTALSLGVRVFPCMVSVVVPKSTPTPVRRTRDDYTNVHRNCSSITFSVHEGEEWIATPASRIGEFTVHDLPTGPRGSQQYTATFEINEDGMLTVTGMHTVTGQSGNVTIDYGSRRIAAAELQEMKDEAAKFRRDDEAVKSSRIARHTLAAYAHGVQRALEAGLRDVLSGPEEDTLAEAAWAAEQWLASLSGRKEAHVYEAMRHGLEGAAEAVMREATQRHGASMQLPRSVLLAAGEEFSKTLLSIMMEAM